LVRGGPERPATAWLGTIHDLKAWTMTALQSDLKATTAAIAGEQVLLRGRLPALAAGERYAGDSVLTPLGFRTEPALPESLLLAAAGVPKGDLLLVRPGGASVVPAVAFGPVSRAGLRAAGAE
jgi:hypothetical protein